MTTAMTAARDAAPPGPVRLRRVIALLLLFVTPMLLAATFFMSAARAQEPNPDMGGVTDATGNPTQTSQDTSDETYDLYSISAILAGFFSDISTPDSGIEVTNTEWETVMSSPANGGSMMGYPDTDISKMLGFLFSPISSSSISQSYSGLRTATASLSTLDASGVSEYAYFGATLNELGLDSPKPFNLGGFGLGTVAGGLVYLLFTLTRFVNFVFTFVMLLISVLNPFNYLKDGVARQSAAMAEGMAGNQQGGAFGALQGGAASALSGLATFISDLYTLLVTLGWTVIVPLMIGSFAISAILFRQTNVLQGAKKIIIRVLFLGLGVPLMGTIYTAAVDEMSKAAQDSNMGANSLILSTYVDFENWAINERLAVPADATIEWDTYRNGASGDSVLHVRKTAQAINASSRREWQGLKPPTSSAMNDAVSDGWSSAAMSGSDDDTSTSGSASQATLDMLQRYMAGNSTNAGAYSSGLVASVASSNSGSDYSAKAEWFTSLQGGVDKLAGDGDDAPKVANNPLLVVAPGTGLTVGQGAVSGPPGSGEEMTSSLMVFSSTRVMRQCGTKVADASGAPLACNLSPLAMYNYLNTRFDQDQVIIYSSTKAPSAATRDTHAAVSPVGSGPMKFLYWIDTVALLTAFVVIGFGYAIALLISNIKNGIKILQILPFALGSGIGAIGQFIVRVLALVVEIMMTLFTYQLVMFILQAIPGILETPLSALSGAALAGSGLLLMAGLVTSLGPALPVAFTILSIVLVLWFTVIAMRMRTAIVKIVEDMMTSIVERLLGVQAATAGAGAGGGGRMGGPGFGTGIGAGVGMGLGSRNYGQSASASASNNGGTNGDGDDGADGGPLGPLAGPMGVGASLMGGGGSGRVDGDIDSDGTLGMGELPDGSEMGASEPGVTDAKSDLELGRDVSENGLSGAPVNGEFLPDGAPEREAGDGPRDPDMGSDGDVLDVASDSAEQIRAADEEANQHLKDSATSGVKAVAKGAEGAGRMAVGDEAGGAKALVDAAGHAEGARNSAQHASEAQEQGTLSNAEKAEQAQQRGVDTSGMSAQEIAAAEQERGEQEREGGSQLQGQLNQASSTLGAATGDPKDVAAAAGNAGGGEGSSTGSSGPGETDGSNGGTAAAVAAGAGLGAMASQGRSSSTTDREDSRTTGTSRDDRVNREDSRTTGTDRNDQVSDERQRSRQQTAEQSDHTASERSRQSTSEQSDRSSSERTREHQQSDRSTSERSRQRTSEQSSHSSTERSSQRQSQTGSQSGQQGQAQQSEQRGVSTAAAAAGGAAAAGASRTAGRGAQQGSSQGSAQNGQSGQSAQQPRGRRRAEAPQAPQQSQGQSQQPQRSQGQQSQQPQRQSQGQSQQPQRQSQGQSQQPQRSQGQSQQPQRSTKAPLTNAQKAQRAATVAAVGLAMTSKQGRAQVAAQGTAALVDKTLNQKREAAPTAPAKKVPASKASVKTPAKPQAPAKDAPVTRRDVRREKADNRRVQRQGRAEVREARTMNAMRSGAAPESAAARTTSRASDTARAAARGETASRTAADRRSEQQATRRTERRERVKQVVRSFDNPPTVVPPRPSAPAIPDAEGTSKGDES